MIQHLRGKFIAISMLSMFLVLALIIGSINLLNYRKVLSDADRTLDYLAQNDGDFPNFSPDFKENSSQIPKEEFSHDMDSHPPVPNFTDETPYESRYFSVLYENHSVSEVKTSRISAVSTEDAESFAESVYSGPQRGFSQVYRYLKSTENEKTLIIFLDCSRSLNTYYSFLMTSIGISLLGLSAVFFLLLIFSSWVFRPVKESLEKQKQFITDASHELKTPLAVIQSDTDVLAIDIGEDNEWILDIQEQTQRLADLTNDLVLLSRIQEQGYQVDKRNFSLSACSQELSSSFQNLFASRHKYLTSQIESDIDISADEKKIRQLLSLLLENASKYTTLNATAEFKVERKGKNVSITVSNPTEQQMSDEQLKHLFDRFYRPDASRNSSTGGYGIGLSVAQAIVQMHKGKISASLSEDQLFSIFVTLPL